MYWMAKKSALVALVAFVLTSGHAAALEQNCRFIQAKPDREACYKRQEDELAARRKPEPPRESIALETLRETERRRSLSQHQQHLPRLLTLSPFRRSNWPPASRRMRLILPPLPRSVA